MAEDLGVEAKEAAVREVAKLLPVPELLQSIASIKADYIARHHANDAQLSTMVADQVDQAHAALHSLSLSENTIDHLHHNFLSIEKYVFTYIILVASIPNSICVCIIGIEFVLCNWLV